MASVQEVLRGIDGVSDVETTIATREAKVEYDPAKTKPEALAKALTDYQGQHDFTATVKS